ncbi:hypothetical protein K2173_026031 [Erythroxylum novogranatense]|uniref:Cytochrome P450 n=1 Tax=Erythroxylum novogranatense TaxID=1862640 RepID=A0AAV8TYT1_9ROSI|nr:hypothetical protein K2173_026031 [Erythroxylum novogranatense]
MALVTIALSLVGLALIFQAWLGKRNSKVKKLPPGPKGLPIIGCLHLLGKYPQRALHDLAKKHGPLMHIRLGFVPTIVVSSPKAAELFLKTHDLVFASRPPVEAAKYIGYDQTSISFSPYGPYWRNMRKLCTLELLSNLKVNSFRSLRKEEIDLLVDSIKQASYERVSVNLSAKVSSLGADISCRMVFGKKYRDKEFGDRGFTAVIHDAMQLIAAPNLADYIPLIAQLDLQGLRKRMKARFVGSNIDFRGQDFEFLPFGSGRRSCPGMRMGMINVRLILARLVHSFDWGLPDGKLPSELDMTEVFGLVTRRATPLLAIPTYRLTI